MKRRAFALASILGTLALQPASAEPADDVLKKIFVHGKPIIDARYRLEVKDQDGFTKNAVASTLRTRLGFETGSFYDFKILVEMENVTNIGDDRFNSTTNGRTQFPVVADPDATEINRAQITYNGIDKTAITAGRQRINLNNQRFVGAVGFRQNEQTFDSVRLTSGVIDKVSFDYFYISRVHRIFGDDHPVGEFDSDSHAFQVGYDGGVLGKVAAYGLLLELDEAPAASSSTWGVRYSNQHQIDKSRGVNLSYDAEFAQQRDRANNPFDYKESYLHGEAVLSLKQVSAKLGYERLGGNGSVGFSTPLATLHKFQGFADVFLTTPTLGIEDFYAAASATWKKTPFYGPVKATVIYHDFESQAGNIDFGNEVDLVLNAKIAKHISAELKGALYDGGNGGPADRSIFWATLSYRY